MTGVQLVAITTLNGTIGGTPTFTGAITQTRASDGTVNTTFNRSAGTATVAGVLISDNNTQSNAVLAAPLIVQNLSNTNTGHVGISLNRTNTGAFSMFHWYTGASTLNWGLGQNGTDTDFHLLDWVNIRYPFTIGIGAPANSLFVTSTGSVRLGSAAVATNATDGFVYIATVAGTPNGTPTAVTGLVPMVYDTSADKLWVYATTWKSPKTPAGAAVVTWQ